MKRFAFPSVRQLIIPIAAVVFATLGPAEGQQRTTATYDDWTLLCEKQSGIQADAQCEVGQEVSIPDQNKQLTMLAYVAVGQPSAKQPKNIAVKLPLGVYLPASAVLIGSGEKPRIVLPYQHCQSDGCVAMAPIEEPALAQLRAANEPMTIAFDLIQGTDRKTIHLKVSLKGLSAALNGMESP